jgi:hypothetical protein
MIENCKIKLVFKSKKTADLYQTIYNSTKPTAMSSTNRYASSR